MVSAVESNPAGQGEGIWRPRSTPLYSAVFKEGEHVAALRTGVPVRGHRREVLGAVVSHQAPHQPALWCQLGLEILCEEAKVGFVFDCCESGQDSGILQKKLLIGMSVWGRSPVGQRPVSLLYWGMSVIPLFSLGNQQLGM